MSAATNPKRVAGAEAQRGLKLAKLRAGYACFLHRGRLATAEAILRLIAKLEAAELELWLTFDALQIDTYLEAKGAVA